MNGLPDYSAALAQALCIVAPLQREEEVSIEQAGGRVLAEQVRADRDLPPFHRAQMDGYALRAADFQAGRAFAVAGKIAAGASASVRIPPGQCVAIATGAPLPEDLDTVIPHEQSDRADPVHFSLAAIQCGNAVHTRGADAQAGEVLISSGALLGSHHLGISAAVGKSLLRVAAAPRVAILTSGDEVRPVGETVQPHQIRNSNAPMAHELLRRLGAAPVVMSHLADEREPTVAAVRDAISSCDLVVTIGGVSAGERDYFPAAFEACAVEPSLRGAAIQPGRPVFVGRAPNGAIVVGLPGNPVSVLATACLFVWPIVRRMLGLDPVLPWRIVELAEDVKPNPQRRAFRPATLREDDKAVVPSWAGSGDLAHTATTHGLLELPVQNEHVRAGTMLRFLAWP